MYLALCVQFGGDAAGSPVDDVTQVWATPLNQVAIVRIQPGQQLWRRAEAEALSFNVAHVSSAAHLPLGRLNRTRARVYQASADLRKRLNAVTMPASSLEFAPPLSLRVVIVGGGVTGLTAALALTRVGYRCTLIERQAVLGGHATTREVHGKHLRNAAFSVFFPEAYPNFWKLLTILGVEPERSTESAEGHRGAPPHDLPAGKRGAC